MAHKYLLGLMMTVTIWSCTKDDTNNQATGTLNITIENVVDGQALQLETGTYTQEKQAYHISRFDYYLSNFQLKTPQNTNFVVPDSYHLVRTQRNSNRATLEIKNIPVGTYNQLNFGLGVDKNRNTSIVQIGDLDPNNNMAWDWNTGYRFIVLEGKTKDNLGLVFHIGTDENYQNYTLQLPKNIDVVAGKTTNLRLTANVAEMFRTPNTINFADINDVMGGDNAKKIAQNYKDMFSVAVE